MYRKIYRDLWRMKGQFFAIFLLTLSAIMIYTAFDGVWYSMNQSVTHFFKETNLANHWFVTNNAQDKSEQIREIDGIKVVQSEFVFPATQRKNESDNMKKIAFTALEKNDVSQFKVIDGDPFQSDTGVWLDYEYAKANQINVGDIEEFQIMQGTYTLKVVGLVKSPEFIAYMGSENRLVPNHLEYGYAFIHRNTLPIPVIQNTVNRVKIVYEEGDDTDKINREVKRILSQDFITSYNQGANISIAAVVNKTTQLFKMSLIYSGVLILLVMLTILTTMKRIVEQQRIQIGTFKAMGLSTYRLLIHYSMYAFLVTMLAGGFGLLLGYFVLTEPLLNIQKMFFTFDTLNITHTTTPNIVYFLIVLLSIVCSMISCKNIMKNNPATTMRGTLFTQKQIFFEKIPFIWNTFRFETKWYLRSTIQNMFRLVATIIGISGSFVLLVASFGLYDSFVQTNSYLYEQQNKYALELKLSPQIDKKQFTHIEEEIGLFDFQYVLKQPTEIENRGSVHNAVLMVFGEGNLVSFQTEDKKPVNMGEGVYITKQFAEQNKIDKNEILKVRTKSGHILYLPITDIILSPVPQGIYFSHTEWIKRGEVFSPTAMYVANSDKKEYLKSAKGVEEVVEKEVQIQDSTQVFNSVRPIIFIMIATAILLSIIVQYNFGMLSFTERYREYATMRVLGFQKQDIRKYIFQDIRTNTILGFLVGIPLSYIMLIFYIQIVSTQQMSYLVYLTPMSITVILLIFASTSFVVGVLLYQRVKRINMVESLKANE